MRGILYMTLLKKFIVLSILLLSVQSASANNWIQNGIWVSDVCTNQYGAWFKFYNNYGVIGSNCTWVINGYQYYGTFGG